MARKMADDILKAEKEGESIITNAEIKAHEIIDDAKLKADAEGEKLLAKASEQANSIIAQAKAGTVTDKQNAEEAADKICGDLKVKAEQNRKTAVDGAISFLIS